MSYTATPTFRHWLTLADADDYWCHIIDDTPFSAIDAAADQHCFLGCMTAQLYYCKDRGHYADIIIFSINI
jgi:hypothetical protein